MYFLQMENLLIVFHLCVSFPFSKVFYINISHNIFLGETPFHPRRSGGTQEENGDCGVSKEEGRSLLTFLGVLVRMSRKALQ